MRDLKTTMENGMTRSVLLIGALVGSVAMASGESELNVLSRLDLVPAPQGALLTIKGTKAPVFTVFRLNDPDRLVIDVTNASTKGIQGHHEGVGPAAGVVASQFSDSKSDVGRILIGLDGATKYDVRAEKTDLIVRIDGAPAAGAAPVAAAPKATAPAAPAREEAPEAKPTSDIIASRIDEQPVKNPATVLKGVAYSKGSLRLSTNGQVAKFELIALANPPRLAIDLYGLKSSARAPKVKDALVRDIRIGPSEDKVRVVVESSSMPAFQATRNDHGLVVALSKTKDADAVSATEVTEASPAQTPSEAYVEIDGNRLHDETAPQAVADAEVKAVEFQEASQGGSVGIKLSHSAKFKVERPDPRTAVLTIDGAKITKGLERSLDTSDLETPVKMVSAFAVPGAQNRVRVVVAAESPISEVVTSSPTGLSWRISSKELQTESVVAENRSAGFATEATQFADEGAPQQRRYVGKKVSFEFKDIDIHNLLRIIAEISKKNMVVSDDVGGRITIRLRNVPWDQAFELILKSKGLGKQEFGNIVRVAPLATLEAEAKANEAIANARKQTAPLSVQLIPVNYATASDMAQRVREVLTPRGNVAIDTRTNTLIVRDLGENMGKVKSLVAVLDTQTPQVLIEARIVEASATFRRAVGVQWGGSGISSTTTGNPTGLIFPSSIAAVGGVTGNAAGTAAVPNYAVSLPVGAGDGSGGALGLTFGSAGGAVQLNLRLSALEAQGTVRTVSAPRVTTLDNATARISQGVSIPFSQVSAAGANTAFIEARLQLEVTPHITMDGSVLMAIHAENNQPDPANTGANGQPGIARKEASTNVLVKDGDTTVLGGIYVRTGSATQAGLPILSKIPVIGFFFRNYSELETKQELLIFITPRILNRQSVAQTL